MTRNINKEQNYNHVFNELQDYMFTNELIYKYSNPKKNDKNNKNYIINKDTRHISNEKNINITFIANKNIETQKNNQSNKKEQNDFFSPTEKDKLFWCFYVLQNGIENYEFIKTISFKTEKDFKFKTAEKIKDYKDVFKSLKLKLNELQDEFINQPCISIKGLIALCYIYNINMIYVKKNTYYEILTNEIDNDHKINVIINNNNNIQTPFNIKNDMIDFYKNNYWKIENLNNPLKSISSYTLLELQNISNKLSIPIKKDDKKLTKQQLYENIIKNI